MSSWRNPAGDDGLRTYGNSRYQKFEKRSRREDRSRGFGIWRTHQRRSDAPGREAVPRGPSVGNPQNQNARGSVRQRQETVASKGYGPSPSRRNSQPAVA